MNVLAMDTSGRALGVGVLKAGQPMCEMIVLGAKNHSATLMPMVDRALDQSGITIEDINLIACVTGPGSFTGVRIGVSAAKALAYACGVRCVGVNALEALSVLPFTGTVCAMLDARNNQVYTALFRGGERLCPDEAITLEKCLTQTEEAGGALCFVGDGAIAHADTIRARFGTAVIADGFHEIRPLAVARTALRDISQSVDYLQLKPHYLRASQAERERAQREGTWLKDNS